MPLPPETVAASSTTVAIRWIVDSSTNKPAVEVSGLSASTLAALRRANWSVPQWQELLAVYAESGGLLSDVGLPPMLGTYRVQKSGLRFEPLFPLEAGIQYRAVIRPGKLPRGDGAGLSLSVSVYRPPARATNATTIVSGIYPSINLLPENLLKFYVHFSAAMSRGHIYDHIHLRDEQGKEVELPFLEIDEELWDPGMTRLTLLLDPGRIKRGVKPLEEIGPALQAGKSYSLTIDRAWRDGAGNPLREDFHKEFRVGPPDREPPDPALWTIQPPPARSNEPLVLKFPKPLDHALAQRMIRITNKSGEPLEGKTVLADNECSWRFTPARPWRPGPYQLVVQTTIEDLAGNNIGKPFDVDLFEGVKRRVINETVKRPFEIR